MLGHFLKDRNGAASAEYVLLLAILGAGIAGGAYYLGNREAAAMRKVGDDLLAEAGGTGSGTGTSTGGASTGGASSGGATSGGASSGGASSGGNGLGNAPGQNPGPGNGNSNGNQNPGSPPVTPPGKSR
jgi:Flp pilus assembly pilin Flp